MGDNRLPEADEQEEIRRELKQIKELLQIRSSGKRPRLRAKWHEVAPKLLDLVLSRGYATSRDAEGMGLCNTDWQRCVADLVSTNPTLKVTHIKHTKYLHRPDFDMEQVGMSVFSIGNCTATDPRLMRFLIQEIQRVDRLNVLDYLQRKFPGRTEKWRDDVLDGLDKFCKASDSGIERELNNLGRPGDWFCKPA